MEPDATYWKWLYSPSSGLDMWETQGADGPPDHDDIDNLEGKIRGWAEVQPSGREEAAYVTYSTINEDDPGVLGDALELVEAEIKKAHPEVTDVIDHERNFKVAEWVPSESSWGNNAKVAMALTPEQVQRLFRWGRLYHFTRPENVARILQEGLGPWDEVGVSGDLSNGYWGPRPGVVYLGDVEYVENKQPSDDGYVVLDIDIKQLDPTKFVTDEDYINPRKVQEWGEGYDETYRGSLGEDWAERLTPPPVEWNTPGDQTQGEWANENADIIDQPEWVEHTFQHGGYTIGYAGWIPPSAISLDVGARDTWEEWYSDGGVDKWPDDPNQLTIESSYEPQYPWLSDTDGSVYVGGPGESHHQLATRHKLPQWRWKHQGVVFKGEVIHASPRPPSAIIDAVEKTWAKGYKKDFETRRDRGQFATASAPGSWWHLTDNPNFALDPNYHPANNTTLGGDWPEAGLMVSARPGDWYHGHDYVRPYVAEIEGEANDMGGYSGEHFIPAAHFPQTNVKRVIPYSAWEAEYYEDMPYTGPDVREFTPEQHQEHLDQANKYIRTNRPHMLSYPCSHCGVQGEQWNECQSCGRVEDPSLDRYMQRGHMPQFRGTGDFYKRSMWNDQGEWSWPQVQQRTVEMPEECPHCTLNGARGETGCTCGYLRQLELLKAQQEDQRYAMADRSGIPEVDALIEAFLKEKQGDEYPLNDEHGFAPHVTLKYIDRDADDPNLQLPVEFEVDSLSLMVGGERTDFELSGESHTSAAPGIQYRDASGQTFLNYNGSPEHMDDYPGASGTNAYDGDRLVGSVVHGPFMGTHYVHHFYVDPDYRGTGVGRKLADDVKMNAQGKAIDGDFIEPWLEDYFNRTSAVTRTSAQEPTGARLSRSQPLQVLSPAEYRLAARRRTGMAERSGDPQLDALIEQFEQEQYGNGWEPIEDVEDWTPDERAMDGVLPGTIKDNLQGVAQGQCHIFAYRFAEFCQEHGVEAYTTEDEQEAASPEEFGYSDRSIKGAPNHCVTQVHLPSGTYMVDWTASQYGYSEFPMVQKIDQSGGWQRQWTSAADWKKKYDYRWDDHTSAAKTAADQTTMYHVAPRSARESIQQRGLEPGKWASFGEPGVYLWKFPDEAHSYRHGMGDDPEDPYDIWEVNHHGLDLKPDPEDEMASAYSLAPIPPNRLHLLSDERTGAWHEAMGQKPPQVMYHNSPARNRGSIQRLGLSMEFQSDEHNTAPGIYCTPQPEISSTEDTWEFDASGLELHQDEYHREWSAVGGAYYVEQDVSPERMRLYHAADGTTASTHDHKDYVKLGMAADPAFIQQWMQAHGPYLYHGVREGHEPQQILQQGIVPGHRQLSPAPNPDDYDDWEEDAASGWPKGYSGEYDQAMEEWWHNPRPNHTFMVTDPNNAYGTNLMRIDLRKLDPANLNPDDDQLRDLGGVPGKGEEGWVYEKDPNHPTLGEQAEALDWGSNPEDTHNAFEAGTIAHRGTIPPEAIEHYATRPDDSQPWQPISNDKTSMKLGMGQAGDLPEGLAITESANEQGDPLFTARLGEAEIGWLVLRPQYEQGAPGDDWYVPEEDSYKVGNITVEPQYRRRGVATALWNAAKAKYTLEHDPEQMTPSGQAWADKTSYVKLGAVSDEGPKRSSSGLSEKDSQKGTESSVGTATGSNGSNVKTSDYSGWSNWDTWHLKLAMDNDYDLYKAWIRGMESGWTFEQLQAWAIQNILGPMNAEAMKNAQEWNDIPPEERIDYGYEDMREKSPEAADLYDALGEPFGFGGPDVSDTDPMIMDEHAINWQEIWESCLEDVGREDEYETPAVPQPEQGLDEPGDFTLPPNWSKRRHAADPVQDVLSRFDAARPEGWTCDGGACALSGMLDQAGVPHTLQVGFYHWPPEHPNRDWRMQDVGELEPDEWDQEHHHWIELDDGRIIDPNGELRGEPRIQEGRGVHGTYEPRNDVDTLSWSPLWNSEINDIDTSVYQPYEDEAQSFRQVLGAKTADVFGPGANQPNLDGTSDASTTVPSHGHPDMPTLDELPLKDKIQVGYDPQHTYWAYLNGDVAFGPSIHGAMRAVAQGKLDEHSVNRLSNLLAAGAYPHASPHDIAAGMMLNGKPRILVTNLDRNAVYDAVAAQQVPEEVTAPAEPSWRSYFPKAAAWAKGWLY